MSKERAEVKKSGALATRFSTAMTAVGSCSGKFPEALRRVSSTTTRLVDSGLVAVEEAVERGLCWDIGATQDAELDVEVQEGVEDLFTVEGMEDD